MPVIAPALLLAGVIAQTQQGSAARGPSRDELMARGAEIHQETCGNCHGADGKSTTITGGGFTMAVAPPFAGSPRIQGHKEYAVHVLMHGLTGPIDGKIYPGAMLPFADKDDLYIAAIASYIRNSFGNTGEIVLPADVARIRAFTKNRREPWTVEALAAALPHRLDVQSEWRFSASSNGAGAARAMTSSGWTSGGPQRDRKSTRLNSSHVSESRMPSSA